MTTSPEPAAYALRISDAEVDRYRTMAARALEREAATLQRAGVAAGARIVDVGCGPAAMLVELARIAGSAGEVVGIEPDPASRAVAEQNVAAAQLGNARVIDGRGDATGLPESAWDVVMMRHVLFHVGAQAPALVAHAAALVRPGGCVYLVDTIGDANRIGAAVEVDDAQMRRYADFQRSRGNDPNTGLRLHVLLAQAGLEVTDHEAWFNLMPASRVAHAGPLSSARDAMLAAGAITAEEAQRFDAERARAAADPLARVFVTNVVAVGRRPA
jgi:precorrin-6B methylase 2